MKTRLVMFVVIVLALSTAAAAQAPPANRAPTAGTLRQIIPGHYVYTQNNAGRLFNSGVVATGDGVLVFDALDSEALARSEREAIAGVIKQPIRYLVSSVFHDPFSKGNLAYGDVFKVGHENYRAGLLDQMQRGQLSDEEQRTRLPNATFRDRMTFYLGGKEIQVLYFGQAHTRGDSVIFVPQDRIAYPSEILFANQFPTLGEGQVLGWLRALEQVDALEADIFVPAHGPIQDDPRQTRQELRRFRQIFTDARDAVQKEIARGATEDQTAAAVLLPQYDPLPVNKGQREGLVRRMYKELSAQRP